MVVRKDSLAASGKPPIPEIAEERLWIAKTTKSEERAGADLAVAQGSDLGTEAAESKEPRRRSENRILIELPDGLECSRCRFGASKNNQIGAAHGGYRLPKPAQRQ